MRTLALLAVVASTGCASLIPQVPIQQIATPYNDAALTPFRGAGTAIVTGEAFLKTRGGDVKPCAGATVTLIPATPYTDEWFEKAVVREAPTAEMDSRAASAVRATQGDARGDFTFDKLPAGTYHVACRVTWEYPGGYGGSLITTGGYAYATATVKAGETVKVIATQ